MAKKDGAFYGLLAIVVTIVWVLGWLYSFFVKNLLPIAIVIGSILLVFGLIKYTKYRDTKRMNLDNIRNSINSSMDKKFEEEKRKIEEERASKAKSYRDLVKGNLFNITKGIENEIEDQTKLELNKITHERENFLHQQENLNNRLLEPTGDENVLIQNHYDPIEAMQKLQNILKDKSNLVSDFWKVLYDNSEFKLIEPTLDINVNFDKLNTLKEPEYFDTRLDNNIYLTEEIQKKKIDFNKKLKKAYEDAKTEIDTQIVSLRVKFEEKHKIWLSELERFKKRKKEKNLEVDLLKTKYFEKDNYSIQIYHQKVLEIITYNPNFTKSIDVEYNKEGNVLIIEYLLPTIEQFPNVKEYRFIKTRNEYKTINYSDRELEKLYNDIIYRIVLDLINVTFEIDIIDAIETVVFNGWSNSINKATGHYNKACILSLVCDKSEFLDINLPAVVPKECFKNLKGISANKISSLTPIKPIISIERTDNRFIESKDIAVDSSTNLASMDWQDFEHLIREIFEKEFSNNNGEVKVTQSSRDGGVDAIAFDPDPIRGGKIIIQAKRYTNIVGVSAVRDLYGTVLNEGATKGILVTTSDYGSESFKFAQDKPITLINGGKLLYLLGQHGYKAKIDIKEAKDNLK